MAIARVELWTFNKILNYVPKKDIKYEALFSSFFIIKCTSTILCSYNVSCNVLQLDIINCTEFIDKCTF